MRRAALVVTIVAAVVPAPAAAQQEEAEVLFEQGNRHLSAAMRARGRRRTRELTAALDAYTACLQLVRSRNALFNLALTFEALERPRDAFNVWSDYLAVEDLTDAERQEGESRRDALRPELAVLRLESDPPGAEVRIGRPDRPIAGHTPVEVAVDPGPQTVHLRLDGHDDAVARAEAAVGAAQPLRAELMPSSVPVQFVVPAGVRLFLDGEAVPAGRSVSVLPGHHVLRLEVDGQSPVERPFEVEVGAEPMVLPIDPPAPPEGVLALSVEPPARLTLDGEAVGEGRELQLRVTPGPHQLRLTAASRPPLEGRVTVDPGERLAVEATLGHEGPDPGLVAARIATATAATLLLGTGVALLFPTRDARDRFREARDNFEQTGETDEELRQIAVDARQELTWWLVGLDLAFALGAAAGVAALVLLAVNGDRPGALRVVAAARAGGAGRRAEGRF
ncbi:MAG: PEGA domain-containing protein [Sandaracinaceae bacterium]